MRNNCTVILRTGLSSGRTISIVCMVPQHMLACMIPLGRCIHVHVRRGKARAQGQPYNVVSEVTKEVSTIIIMASSCNAN